MYEDKPYCTVVLSALKYSEKAFTTFQDSVDYKGYRLASLALLPRIFKAVVLSFKVYLEGLEIGQRGFHDTLNTD